MSVQCPRRFYVKNITTKKGKTYARNYPAPKNYTGPTMRCPGRMVVRYVSIKDGGDWYDDEIEIEYACNQCRESSVPQGFPTDRMELENFLNRLLENTDATT